MPDYSFEGLSSFEFELLVQDLLQEELELRLEGFKPGRDTGIDLRGYTEAEEGQSTLIIQCKHYSRSKVSNLLHDLSVIEYPKIKRLAPDRYIVATSLPLSPQDKESIKGALSPFCLSTLDILGREDLNNLLGRWPEIEQKTFKLWLTSTPVLERIIQSATFVQSEIELDRIRHKLKLYVQNNSFPVAKSILEDQHYCLIAGIPGIGKTTLAEILSVDYIDRGYRFVRVIGDINEAVASFKPQGKTVFYYDDFLGTTSLEYKFGKNEEIALVNFVEAVRRSDSRLILTTREYILNQAKNKYERLDRSSIDLNKCVVKLEDYTEQHRAEILYNHLYFSDLPTAFKQTIVKDRAYRIIVQHPHYNPRLIEWMTDLERVTAEAAAETYSKHFLHKLDSPGELWDHAFREQISEPSRRLLLTLITLPTPVVLEDAERAFDAFQSAMMQEYGQAVSPEHFERAIKELEGNFTLTELSGVHATIRFHNPSINDYLEGQFFSNSKILRLVLRSVQFFDQLERFLEIRVKFGHEKIVANDAAPGATELAISLLRGIDLPASRPGRGYVGAAFYWPFPRPHSIVSRATFALNNIDVELCARMPDLVAELLDQVESTIMNRSVSLPELYVFLQRLEATELVSQERWNRFLLASAPLFSESPLDLEDFESAADFFDKYGDRLPADGLGTSLKTRLSGIFYDFLVRTGPEWLEREGDYETLRRYADQIGEISSITDTTLDGLDEKLRDVASHLENQSMWDEVSNDRWREAQEEEVSFDIDHMFSGLLE